MCWQVPHSVAADTWMNVAVWNYWLYLGFVRYFPWGTHTVFSDANTHCDWRCFDITNTDWHILSTLPNDGQGLGGQLGCCLSAYKKTDICKYTIHKRLFMWKILCVCNYVFMCVEKTSWYFPPLFDSLEQDTVPLTAPDAWGRKALRHSVYLAFNIYMWAGRQVSPSEVRLGGGSLRQFFPTSSCVSYSSSMWRSRRTVGYFELQNGQKPV